MTNKFALLIGMGEHIDPSLAKLRTPSVDVNSLAELLADPDIGGFTNVGIRLNKTFAEIQYEIADFFADKKPDDLLLLYFTGHGILDEQGRLYLATKDTKHNRLSGSSISSRFVTEEMDCSLSRRQVLILDCCHSGAVTRGAKSSSTIRAITKSTFEGTGYGKVILTATDTTQLAWEGDKIIGEATNSLFTHFLIDGLKTGKADVNDDGNITLDEWYDFAYNQIINTTTKQKPRKWIYNQEGGQFIIAKNNNISIVNSQEAKNTKQTYWDIKKIFGSQIKIVVCPYCVTETRYKKSIISCPNCKRELPPIYTINFEKKHPAFIQVIGGRASGKSTFYQSLTLMLMKMGNFWKNYSFAPLNDGTLYYQQVALEYIQKGYMPPATTLGKQDAYLMQLDDMDRWGSRTLVMQDIAGENFHTLKFPVDDLNYILFVPFILMMVSISDENAGRSVYTMDSLMNGYIHTLARYDSNYLAKNRNAVVVLSKSDLLVNEMPEEVRRYIQEDPLNTFEQVDKNTHLNLNEYVKKMKQVSDVIRDWASLSTSGKNMIMLAKKNNINLEFSAISSLGSSPNMENQLMINSRPYRVLDPFFWALEFQSQEIPRTKAG
jgi:hypothetical protein